MIGWILAVMFVLGSVALGPVLRYEARKFDERPGVPIRPESPADRHTAP